MAKNIHQMIILEIDTNQMRVKILIQAIEIVLMEKNIDCIV